MQALMVAMLPLLGVLIGALLQYAAGTRLELRKQSNAQRAQAYSDFFKAVAALAQERTPSMLALAADAKSRICIYGADSVVKKLSDFEAAGATALDDAGRASLVSLLAAMRADITGGKMHLHERELGSIIFGRDA